MIRLPLVGLLFALFALAGTAFAAESTATPKMVTCKDGTQSEAGQGACSHHGGVKSPTMVMCTDGTKSQAGQGACSHHGGVKPSTAQKPTTTGSKSATPDAAHSSAGGADTTEPSGANDD